MGSTATTLAMPSNVSSSSSSSSNEIMAATTTPSRKVPPPSPLEDSDSSDELPAPIVLDQVLSDLLRLTEELGPTHIRVAETWNSLGLIRLHMQQNINAAVKCHQEALSIYRVNEEAGTLDIAVTLNDLGRCYERDNNCVKALQTYMQAAELMQNDPSIRANHSVVESVKRSMARLRRE